MKKLSILKKEVYNTGDSEVVNHQVPKWSPIKVLTLPDTA